MFCLVKELFNKGSPESSSQNDVIYSDIKDKSIFVTVKKGAGEN